MSDTCIREMAWRQGLGSSSSHRLRRGRSKTPASRDTPPDVFEDWRNGLTRPALQARMQGTDAEHLIHTGHREAVHNWLVWLGMGEIEHRILDNFIAPPDQLTSALALTGMIQQLMASIGGILQDGMQMSARRHRTTAEDEVVEVAVDGEGDEVGLMQTGLLAEIRQGLEGMTKDAGGRPGDLVALLAGGAEDLEGTTEELLAAAAEEYERALDLDRQHAQQEEEHAVEEEARSDDCQGVRAPSRLKSGLGVDEEGTECSELDRVTNPGPEAIKQHTSIHAVERLGNVKFNSHSPFLPLLFELA
eukprot:s344_g5.t1